MESVAAHNGQWATKGRGTECALNKECPAPALISNTPYRQASTTTTQSAARRRLPVGPGLRRTELAVVSTALKTVERVTGRVTRGKMELPVTWPVSGWGRSSGSPSRCSAGKARSGLCSRPPQPAVAPASSRRLGQGLSALSGRSWERDTHGVSCTRPATDRPGTSAATQDGLGLAVAVTQARQTTVRVHLIGRLEAVTARILTAAFAALYERPGQQDVSVDLSAPTFVDCIGLSVLENNRVLLVASARSVISAHPYGADLRLLDWQPGRAGRPRTWSATDILHWKPKAARSGASVPMTARYAKNNSTRRVS